VRGILARRKGDLACERTLNAKLVYVCELKGTHSTEMFLKPVENFHAPGGHKKRPQKAALVFWFSHFQPFSPSAQTQTT